MFSLHTDSTEYLPILCELTFNLSSIKNIWKNISFSVENLVFQKKKNLIISNWVLTHFVKHPRKKKHIKHCAYVFFSPSQGTRRVPLTIDMSTRSILISWVFFSFRDKKGFLTLWYVKSIQLHLIYCCHFFYTLCSLLTVDSPRSYTTRQSQTNGWISMF